MRNKATAADWILWDLKLRGDVNENYDGGSAVGVLRERLLTHAPASQHSKFKSGSFTTSIARLVTIGKASALKKGMKYYAIRLTCDESELGRNPFGDAPSTALVPVTPDNALLAPHWREWPISQRQLLIEAVSASVREDLAQYKSVAFEGL